jgi:hypothetical protein
VVVATPISLFAKKPLSYCPHKTYCPYVHTLDVNSMLVLEERRGEVVIVCCCRSAIKTHFGMTFTNWFRREDSTYHSGNSVFFCIMELGA